MIFVRGIAGVGLLVLPGVWLAFGVPLLGTSYVARLAIAGALSPAIAGLEFCLARWVGLSFVASAWFLVVLNIAAIWLLIRHFPATQIRWKPVASFLAVYLVLAACIAIPWLHWRNTRIFDSHAWMHIGIVNQFPEGPLVPEDPELAGVNLAYPWLGHAYWAVMGWVMWEPPTRVYVVTNLLSLLWVCVLFYEVCRALGASDLASRVGLLWLGVRTNIAGALYLIGASFLFGGNRPVPGDIRFGQWIGKFSVFESIAFALPMFAGLMLVCVEALRRWDRSRIAMVVILLACIGLIYPLLFPAALGFCSMLLLLLLWQARSEPAGTGFAVSLPIGICVAVAVVLTNAHLITTARTTPLLHLMNLASVVTKSGTTLGALAPFLAAIVFVPRAQLRQNNVLLLLAGALPSVALRSLLQVGAGHNEYKFLFTAALSLGPVAALAIDRWATLRLSPTLLLAGSALLVLASTLSLLGVSPAMSRQVVFPHVNEAGFYLQLAPVEPQAGWLGAIRARTPANTIVVARRSDVFLPAVLGHSLWAPPQSHAEVPGYWIDHRWNLVEERGYSPNLIDQRGAVTNCLYESNDEMKLRAAEMALLSLGRPVAIVFAPGEGKGFLALIERESGGQPLYHDATGIAVWLLDPRNRTSSSRRTGNL